MGAAVRGAIDGVPVHVLGVPVEFIPQGRADGILAELGLDRTGLAASIRSALAAVAST